jgi:TPR repeat protein
MRAAVDYYKAAALRGNEPGRANYARCLEFGIGVPENPHLASFFGPTRYDTKVSRAIRMFKAKRYDDAAALFRQAADDGDASAAFNIAWMAEEGFIRHPEAPVTLYEQAVERGSTDAQNNLALLLIKAGRVDEAGHLLKAAADAGNAYALNNLAIVVEQGKVGCDLGIVPTLYKQAADAGLPEGMMNYAEILESGAGIRRSPERARAFYALAFEKSKGRLAAAGEAVRRLRD